MITDHSLDCNSNNNGTLPLTGNGARGDYHEWRLLVSDALRDAGHENDADSYWDCAADNASYSAPHTYSLPAKSNIVRVYVCEEHGVQVVRKTCKLRVCPDCAKRRSNALVERFTPVFDDLLHAHHDRFRFRKIVLTTSLSLHDPDVAAQYRRFRKAVVLMFDKLLPSGWRKNQGFIVSDEFGENGLKLHFHILFYGQWIDNKERKDYPLSSAWRQVTGGDCEITYISGIDGKDLLTELRETLKYVSKLWKTDPDTGQVVRLPPDCVVALHTLLKSQRRVRTYGIFQRVPAVADRHPECPDCGCAMHRWNVMQYNIWLDTGWVPSEQTLFLRTGNKSPPNGLPDGGESPALVTPGRSKPIQPPLSEKFRRHNYDLSWM